MDFNQILENISDKSRLQDNLTFAALYIALFENFASTVVDRIQSFYCTGFSRKDDGNYEILHSPEYNKRIKNRSVDEKGNKNTLKASILWLQDNGAIDQNDYSLFLEAKQQRNLYAHQLTDIVLREPSEQEIQTFFNLFSLYQRIDRWWINEIEIPCSGEYLPGSYDENEEASVTECLYEIMIAVLYSEQSESVQTILKKRHAQG